MTITFRPATPDDSPSLFVVSEHAIADLAQRKGYGWDAAGLASCADRCVVAEKEHGSWAKPIKW